MLRFWEVGRAENFSVHPHIFKEKKEQREYGVAMISYAYLLHC